MKKMLIAGNWKMNTNLFEAQKLAEYVLGGVKNMPKVNIEILMCPPYTNLQSVRDIVENSAIYLGAQNCHYEPKGAYTGEISLRMLKQLDVSYVIVGHSERRQYFGETDEIINKKVKAVLEYDLTPILCIGETLQEREADKTFDVLKTQLDIGLDGISKESYDRIVIAYEPVWAIGTGVSASSEQAQEAHKWIRNYLENYFQEKAADIIILYGGSMKPSNCQELLSQEDINGGLIGGASLDPESFFEIIQKAQKIVESL